VAIDDGALDHAYAHLLVLDGVDWFLQHDNILIGIRQVNGDHTTHRSILFLLLLVLHEIPEDSSATNVEATIRKIRVGDVTLGYRLPAFRLGNITAILDIVQVLNKISHAISLAFR
jgi:hypothetical protein